MKTTEISKVLGEQWKNMDAEAKAPYNEKANRDKERCVVTSLARINREKIRLLPTNHSAT